MKKAFIFFLLLQLAYGLKAQQFAVSLTDEFKSDANESARNGLIKCGNTFIGLDAEYSNLQFPNAMKLSKNTFAIKLSRYDSSMALIKESELSLDGSKKFGPFMPKLEMMYNKLFVIYYIFDNSKDKNSNLKIMAAEVDPESLNISEPIQILAAGQEDYNLLIWNKFLELLSEYKFILKQSPDGKKMLVLWTSENNNKFFYSILNDSFQVTLSAAKEIQSSDLIKVNSACIDNNENVYVGYKTKLGKQSLLGRQNFQSHIIICQEGKPDIDYQLQLGNGYPGEAMLVPSKKENVIDVLGTYNAIGTFETDNESVAGAYLAKIDMADFKLSTAVQYPLSDELITEFKNEDWVSLPHHNIGTFDLQMKSYQLEDGSIDIVGEYYCATAATLGYKTFDNWNGVFSGSILNIRFGTDGSVVFSRVPKLRAEAIINGDNIITKSLIGGHYYALPYKSGIMLFYNDAEKNLEKDLSENPARSDDYNKLVLVAATITADGKVNRQNVVDSREDNFLGIPELAVSKAPSSLFILFEKIGGLGGVKDKLKCGTISIK